MQVKKVLGTRLDLVGREEALDLIGKWLTAKAPRLKMVATAYSEFFVKAIGDVDFRMALESSDLIIPDGIGPLTAINFTELLSPSDNVFQKVVKGMKTGGAVLAGKVGQPVAGYWLFKELVQKAVQKGWRVFLLGGFGDTAEQVKLKLEKLNGNLEIEADPGSQRLDRADDENERVIEKINMFKPDLLFVAYGPVKQEKWLAVNKGKLKVKVALGVGGTFDEFLGLVKPAPVFMTRIGLKWFWRLLQQPQRLPRIFKATIVFVWLVFVESLRKE